MTFLPDRRPMRHWSVRTADALDLDPVWMRPRAFLLNPVGEVNHQFDLAEDWALFSADWVGGYRYGTNPGPLALFHEPEAAVAFRGRCFDRYHRGLSTYLYLGRVLPNGETFNTRDATTKDWMAANLAPYFAAGLTGIFMDYFSGTPDSAIARANARDFAAFGKRFGGNAVPYDQTGLDGAANPQVPPERLDQASLRACAWYAEAGEIETIGDPGGLWHFDPKIHEVRYGFYDDSAKFPKPADAIAKIRSLRSRGYVVDLNVAARPEVETELLKGDSDGGQV